MRYLKVKQIAEQWGISGRRVRVLCEQGKIEGVIRQGRAYLIPADAVKPVDGRTLRGMDINPEYTELFAHIDALKAELDKRRPLTQGELQRLRNEFLVDYTYNSNAIEGNTLTLQETALVLEGITIDQKPLKDHLEAVGHRDAFLYIEQLIRDQTPFSERVIKEIHSLVLMDRPEDKGVYRRIPVRIMGAHHEPPQPYLVAPQMEQLVTEFTKTKLHPIEAAALFHLKFEGIHPFIDGNGRTGRLILNFMLMQNGYPPINVKFADRKQYYAAFDAFYRDGDAGAMVRMVGEDVESEISHVLSTVADNERMIVRKIPTSELAETNRDWRYCVVGNIIKTHIDEQGILRYGSSAFRGGTKVYLCGKYWKKEHGTIGVIGHGRYKRYVFSDVSPDLIENVRCQRAYKPAVLALMDNWEFHEDWWGKDKEDKAETQRFVDIWNSGERKSE